MVALILSQDRDFGKHGLARAHMNPAAQLATTLRTYGKYTLLKAYTGETFFWALAPNAGDVIDFKFNPPIAIEKWGFCMVLLSEQTCFHTSRSSSECFHVCHI